jgi:hypothetical protein
MNLDLSSPQWSLVGIKQAQKLGWGPKTVDKDKVKAIIASTIDNQEASSVAQVKARINEEYGEVPENELTEAISALVRNGRVGVFSGAPEQTEKPQDLVYGKMAVLQPVKQDQALIAPAAIAKRGWKEEKKGIRLSGSQGLFKIWPLLKQLGQIYSQGGRSSIDLLEILDLEVPGGGKLRVSLEDVSPEGVQQLDELFATLAELTQKGENTELELEIKEPDQECAFVRKIS